MLRGTAILNAFYRLGGATIGKGVQLDTVTLHDLECIHIGDHTIIGRDVNFQPARIHAGRLVKQPIQDRQSLLHWPEQLAAWGRRHPRRHQHPASLRRQLLRPLVRSRPVGSAPDLVEVFDVGSRGPPDTW